MRENRYLIPLLSHSGAAQLSAEAIKVIVAILWPEQPLIPVIGHNCTASRGDPAGENTGQTGRTPEPGFGLSGDVHTSQTWPTNQLDSPHAMGTNAFSRTMIPRLPLRLRSGLRQSGDFGSGLRRPLGASTFCCSHRPIRVLRCAQSLRAGSGCLPRTQADEFWSQGEHPTLKSQRARF
jgi:hypothetical protein